jgi:hypothetical protein
MSLGLSMLESGVNTFPRTGLIWAGARPAKTSTTVRAVAQNNFIIRTTCPSLPQAPNAVEITTVQVMCYLTTVTKQVINFMLALPDKDALQRPGFLYVFLGLLVVQASPGHLKPPETRRLDFH